jgi:Tol biopolymer transport system component
VRRALRTFARLWRVALLLVIGTQAARWFAQGDGQLTYVSIDATGGPLGNDIWLMDVARRYSHNLTQNARANNRAPAWSPDGRQLAFISDRNGAAQLFVATFPGSPRHLMPLLEQPIASGYRPVWSPDGRWLAVEIAHIGNTDIYIVDSQCQSSADGCADAVRRLTDEPTDDRFPVWSPDSQRFAFVSWRAGDAEIYAMRADGGGLRALSNNGSSWDTSPSWSRDGERLLYMALQSGQYQLYLLTLADNFRLPVFRGDHQPILPLGSAPVWSADGARVLLSVSVSDSAADIMMLDMNCLIYTPNCPTPATTLAPSPVDELTPVWSPDERWVYFVSGRQGTLAIYRADATCPSCKPEAITDTRRYSITPTFRPQR